MHGTPQVFRSVDEVHAAFSDPKLFDRFARLKRGNRGRNFRNVVNREILGRILSGWNKQNRRIKPFFELLANFPPERTSDYKMHLHEGSAALRRVHDAYSALFPPIPDGSSLNPLELDDLNNQLSGRLEIAKSALISLDAKSAERRRISDSLAGYLSDLGMHFHQVINPSDKPTY